MPGRVRGRRGGRHARRRAAPLPSKPAAMPPVLARPAFPSAAPRVGVSAPPGAHGPSHAVRPVRVVAVRLTGLVAFGAGCPTDFYLALAAFGSGRTWARRSRTVQLTLSVFMVGFAVSMLVYRADWSDRSGGAPVNPGGWSRSITVASVACALAPNDRGADRRPLRPGGRRLRRAGAGSARWSQRRLRAPRWAAQILAYIGNGHGRWRRRSGSDPGPAYLTVWGGWAGRISGC